MIGTHGRIVVYLNKIKGNKIARKTLRLDRKGPSESATLFPKGTKKKGNDGNMWIHNCY